MPEQLDFLGRGWSFPPEFNKSTKLGGEVAMVDGTLDIDQSLHILLRTSLGERVMQPRYGCNLSDYLFEPSNTALLAFLKETVFSAIIYHEPRIKIEELEVVSEGPDLLEGRIRFFIGLYRSPNK